MAEGPVQIRVKQTGRVRKPNLDNGDMTAIGQEMVAAQKARWAAGVNADGAKARPLSRRYTYIKAKVRRTNRPIRDMHLSGILLNNFTLRKAINNVIRAEPTSRVARDQHAKPANKIEQMIGFSGSDIKASYDEIAKRYGDLARRMWIPVK